MINASCLIPSLIALLLVGCGGKTAVEVTSPYQKVESPGEAYMPLPINEIKPEGWLLDQIRENLDGFTGRLDTLVPSLILNDRIYGEDRLTRKVKNKNVGALADTGAWQVQFLWWNSETQSNWRDGYIRSAIMAHDERHLSKLKQYVDYILSTQDEDGYLGIYDKDLRYAFDNENGELWAKASLLRGLLAWYEHTGDANVLTAIERAVKNVIANYPPGASHPFYSKQPHVGGTSHGLTLTDVLESLYRITGNESYRDYCLFLYKDFSSQTLSEDAQYDKLLNDTLPLYGHGVHTYEHLRCLAAAYYASGNPMLKTALEHFLAKINREVTASGAAVGDEWIGGRGADATTRGYEYCSLHELMHSYISLLVKSGDPSFGDKAELLFFNPAQGARNPSRNCIAYLKSDNSYAMTGGLNGDTRDKNQTRYSYSPAHQEAAVCCVPNAGRIAPYFVQHMWLKGKGALVASLLGPNTLRTSLDDKPILIHEATSYPFDGKIKFEVTADQSFALMIRIPHWATDFSASESFDVVGGYIAIDKDWRGTMSVEIDLRPSVIVREDVNGEKFFTYGSLVLALPIAAREIQGKSFPVPGYYNYQYAPENAVIYSYSKEPLRLLSPAIKLKTLLINTRTRMKDTVELIPMGQTILRQVTFK